jgi:hypothetical protein
MKLKLPNIKFEHVRSFLGRLKANWKTKYRLVIRNDSTHQDRFALLLSPKNIFVVFTTSAVFLIAVTAILIAFTPLRVYIPGYTTPDEFRKYRDMSHRVDSLDNMFRMNQQYIDNLTHILTGTPYQDETQDVKPSTVEAEQDEFSDSENSAQAEADHQIRQEADKILASMQITPNSKAEQSLTARGRMNSFTCNTPVSGAIIKAYNAETKHYGVDIQGDKSNVVCAVADGVVIYSGFDINNGYVMVIQHFGNLVSVYKRNERLLKSVGYVVSAGEPIGHTGSGGTLEKGKHLHFEMWYNGFPVNPALYLIF